MKLTKSQKVFSAILGVALCALILDRAFDNSPPRARAAEMSDNLAATGSGSIQGAVTDNAPFGDDLGVRLRQVQSGLSGFPKVRDAFNPSPAWIVSAEDSGPTQRAITFQNSHRLRAIIESTGPAQAIVDDSLITVGQSLDGFRLVSITRSQATFSDHEVSVTLNLPNGSAVKRTQPD
jgi:hypothetical protein